MTSQVRNNQERSRYELVVDGDVVGVADYSLAGNRVVIPHTEIDSARRGQGLGAVLVRGVLDDLRAAGHTVVPRCWNVARFIEEHPEYRDLAGVSARPTSGDASRGTTPYPPARPPSDSQLP